MRLDGTACYRALRTRDARFDGRFFVGVRSTGVFCRPVCPAPTPNRRNCDFFPCAAAAQEAGFRPCLRCRPEASPGTPAWLGSSATVSRALRLIGEGALDEAGIDALAARLGVGARHLRRLFDRHLGASPLSVARTRRILFAKRLIDETDLPFCEIALAAGFASVRRFNADLRQTYGRPPSALRAARPRPSDPVGAMRIGLRLPFRPPFDWDALIGFLTPRATPGVEAVEPDCYRRSVRLGETCGVVEVRPVAGRNHLQARIQLSDTRGLIQVAERLRRLFDLGADPAAIDAHLESDPKLAARVRAHPGIRIPGAWDAFELGVRAILGQQVTVRGATELARRLVEAYGEGLPSDEPVRTPGQSEQAAQERCAPERLFPTPDALAEADLSEVGLPRSRAQAVRRFAAAVAQGSLPLDGPLPLDAVIERLRELPGIGPWTAHYVAMRALGQPDAFPAGDLGLRRAFGGGKQPIDAPALEAHAEAWRPWRAYAAMHLWIHH